MNLETFDTGDWDDMTAPERAQWWMAYAKRQMDAANWKAANASLRIAAMLVNEEAK